MNTEERATMQDTLDALESIVNANPRKWQELSEPMGEFERWAKSRANHAAIKLRAALAQPEQVEPVAWLVDVADFQNQYCVTDEDDAQLIDDCTNHNAKVTPLYATPQQPAKDEFAARGTLASLKCWHRLTQEESDDLVKMFAAKELTCTWTQDADGYYSTQCGEAYVFNDGTPAQNNAYYCHHCGGKLIEAKVRQG